MEIDVAKQIGAVTRRVENRDHEGKPARVAVAGQTYSTTPDDLWDAITSPERLPRWFLPVTGDLKPGGRYQLKGNAGGEILVCEPPRRLKVTWEYGGEVSWLEVIIAPSPNNGASLTLEHVAYVSDERWNQFGPGAVGIGWDLTLAGLEHHTATRSARTAEEGMQWMMSDEGKRFMRQSSDSWREASIASGTDVETARASADRCLAAYTGA